MNGIFHLIATAAPWREVPPEYGLAGTVARHFRRLKQAGLWERMLQALCDVGSRRPLQGRSRMIFRAAPRAYRHSGLGIIVLRPRLGFLGALPGPSWIVADPDFSKTRVALQMCHRKDFGGYVLKWGKACEI